LSAYARHARRRRRATARVAPRSTCADTHGAASARRATPDGYRRTPFAACRSSRTVVVRCSGVCAQRARCATRARALAFAPRHAVVRRSTAACRAVSRRPATSSVRRRRASPELTGRPARARRVARRVDTQHATPGEGGRGGVRCTRRATRARRRVATLRSECASDDPSVKGRIALTSRERLFVWHVQFLG
jgi:hypothetical protein